MNTLTWSWLGGFFSADGSVARPTRQSKFLSVGQARREPLDLIHQFLCSSLPGSRFTPVRGPYNNAHAGIYVQNVYGAFLPTLRVLYPRLRGRRVKEWSAKWLEKLHQDVLSDIPIDDDWVVGFWEGDGSVYLSGASDIQIVFAQKDVTVLEEIRTYLADRFDAGTIYDYKYKVLVRNRYPARSVARLTYHCGIHEQDMLGWLYENVRCEFRRSQLGAFLEAIRLFKTSSEEESYTNYGKPGYHMPPGIKALYQK